MSGQNDFLLLHRHLAFISLALGFLVIWTAVLAGLLVSRTVKDQSASDETSQVFHTHEDIGRIAFSLGHEMVSTVDWLVSESPEPKESIALTWKITDNVLKLIRDNSLNQWLQSLTGIIDMVEVRLNRFRSSLSSDTNAVEVTHFYLGLSDLMLKKASMYESLSQPLCMPSMSYILFIEGMSNRFGELALGTIFVKSGLLVNRTEYTELRTSSEHFIESALRFVPRARSKHWELHDQDPHIRAILSTVSEHILSGERNHQQVVAPYIDAVKEQIVMLVLVKDALNSTVSSYVEKLSQKSSNALAFHLSLAIVAFVAVLICLFVAGCTFSQLGKLQKVAVTYSPSDNYFNNSDKTQILSSSNFLKPHCYL